MKRYWLLILPFLFLGACNDDDDGYSLDKFWINIATVENPNSSNSFYLKLDDGTRLWVGASNYPSYRPETGQRVLANYTILNDRPEESGYDHDVKLNDAYNILTKDIIALTPENEENVGNDPIGITDMWIGSDYLNIRFYYPGYNKTHYLNLVKDDSKTYTDGKTHLEFRHNANDDQETYRVNGYVSFYLRSLVQESMITSESMTLVIHTKQLDGTDKEYEYTYNFTDKSTIYKDFSEEDFNNGKDSEII